MDDLNKFEIENDGNFGEGFEDNSILSKSGVSVYFRDIEKHLVSHIQKSDVILGAVAWLTSFTILDALAKIDNVSLIVQKEDFLRPDVGSNTNFKNQLKRKYNALKCDLARFTFDNILSSVSISGSPSIEPVRCVGNHNKDKAPAFPRMHNKFLIFAKLEDGNGEYGSEKIVPYAVWTGSFNLTRNATMSLENALYITDEKIVRAYFKEYGQITAMSESLDWTSEWTVPEWRIGT